jgi:GNAT superfamily N-acetyltransferase
LGAAGCSVWKLRQSNPPLVTMLDELGSRIIGGHRVTASQVREIVAAQDNFILLAYVPSEPGQLLGCVHVEEKDREGYFGMLAVNVDLQARGVGAFLLKAAEDFARDRFGARKMLMTVIAQRTELIAWYERIRCSLAGLRLKWHPCPPQNKGEK